MGTFSIWHWLIVLAVVLVLFGGKGKISSLMGDFGKGLKSFKKGMKEDDPEEAAADEPKVINGAAERSDAAAAETDKTKSA
ncbi:MAG: twin-arginine translocase TatA/TatE family subunit [Hyphomicrobiales bacterium]|nr:twin-arginine translocase TatA/TatE family subunit [Hyphomicrobiales bacterium]MCP5372706.1 twin-arginine translocase TatA/TatE family subunit [Hyphomicrobiales bacterium]